MAVNNLLGIGLQGLDYLKNADDIKDSSKEAQSAAQKGIDYTQQQLTPYTNLGTAGAQGYLSLLKDPSSVANDPGYQFQFNEGQRGLERSAAAKSGLLSGGTLQSLVQYGQDYASTSYDKALSRNLALIQPGLQATQSAVEQTTKGYENIGQAAIDREALQAENRRNLINGLIGANEGTTNVNIGTGNTGSNNTSGGGNNNNNGVPIVGDWSLSDIPDAISKGWEGVSNGWDGFVNWLEDPNTSIFDPSTWGDLNFDWSGITDYTVNDFMKDLGFL